MKLFFNRLLYLLKLFYDSLACLRDHHSNANSRYYNLADPQTNLSASFNLFPSHIKSTPFIIVIVLFANNKKERGLVQTSIFTRPKLIPFATNKLQVLLIAEYQSVLRDHIIVLSSHVSSIVSHNDSS